MLSGLGLGGGMDAATIQMLIQRSANASFGSLGAQIPIRLFSRTFTDVELKSLALATDVIQIMPSPGVDKIIIPMGFIMINQNNVAPLWTNSRSMGIRCVGTTNLLVTSGALGMSLLASGFQTYVAAALVTGGVNIDNRNKAVEVYNTSPPLGVGPNGNTVSGTTLQFLYYILTIP
jgi:hypothetical protein